MNTAEEMIQEVQGVVSGMGDDLDAIEDFSGLICLLLTAPDIDGECPGLHRLVHVIREHLHTIKQRHLQAERAIRRLANP